MLNGKHLIAKLFWVLVFSNILCSQSYAIPTFSYTESVNDFTLTITGGDVAGPPPDFAFYDFDLTGNWRGRFIISEYPGGQLAFSTDAVYLSTTGIFHDGSSSEFTGKAHGILTAIDAGGTFGSGSFIGSVPHTVGGTPQGVDTYAGSSSFDVNGIDFTNYTITVQGVHVVPEPSTLVLLVIGLGALMLLKSVVAMSQDVLNGVPTDPATRARPHARGRCDRAVLLGNGSALCAV